MCAIQSSRRQRDTRFGKVFASESLALLFNKIFTSFRFADLRVIPGADRILPGHPRFSRLCHSLLRDFLDPSHVHFSFSTDVKQEQRNAHKSIRVLHAERERERKKLVTRRSMNFASRTSDCKVRVSSARTTWLYNISRVSDTRVGASLASLCFL